jgi:uncharacterized protein (TIGR02647 family)
MSENLQGLGVAGVRGTSRNRQENSIKSGLQELAAQIVEGSVESVPVYLFILAKGIAVPFTSDLVDELNTLIRFDLTCNQQGVKVHKTADATVIAATGRLHGKGLLTQVDGGYLTSLGRNAAEHAQAALALLTAGAALSSVSSSAELTAAQS